MSLQLEELLRPLPGGMRGDNLRYAPIYDKVKEARFEDEDDAPQGEWQRTRKRADVPAVLRLTIAAIRDQSKDLQLAAWLGESLVRRDGFSAISETLRLFQQLQERFWESVYPELDEGSPDFRATPQEWFAGRCDYLLRRVSLTNNRLDWLKYQEAKTVGYEPGPEEKEKLTRREAAIAENKITAEEFDDGVKATSKDFYAQASADLEAGEEALRSLASFCDEKYGAVAPNFASLRRVLEDLKLAVNALLAKKREMEPVPVAEADVTEGSTAGLLPAGDEATEALPTIPESAVTNPEAVFAVIARLAERLRKHEPSSVTPYLLVRSLRWGELRSAGDPPDPSLLAAPTTELRQRLKQLYAEGAWQELQEAAEAAAALPYGRAWLDLQRYAWQACEQLSQSAPARAICSEVRGLVADFPSLPNWVLTDDTPAANPDTLNWLQQHVVPPAPEPETLTVAPWPAAASNDGPHEANEKFETAQALAKRGRMAEAMELLNTQISQDNAGRERFLRQFKIAQLWLSSGHYAIAHPILHSLYGEIQRRDLIEWEGANFVVQLLTLLVQCIDKTSKDAQERTQIYNLLCRLEPTVALQLQK